MTVAGCGCRGYDATGPARGCRRRGGRRAHHPLHRALLRRRAGRADRVAPSALCRAARAGSLAAAPLASLASRILALPGGSRDGAACRDRDSRAGDRSEEGREACTRLADRTFPGAGRGASGTRLGGQGGLDVLDDASVLHSTGGEAASRRDTSAEALVGAGSSTPEPPGEVGGDRTAAEHAEASLGGDASYEGTGYVAYPEIMDLRNVRRPSPTP